MDKEDWDAYEELYKKYESARAEYEEAQMNLRGTFSELSRHYEEGTVNEGRLYQEQKAHEKFTAAREKLHLFIQEKVKK